MPRTIAQHPASALALLLAAVGWLFLALTGVSAQSATALVAVVGAQAWAGGYLWRLLRAGRATTPEVVGMGLALGTSLAVLSGLIVKLATGTNLGWAIPAVAAAVLWVVRRRSHESRPVPGTDAATRWGVVAAFVIGIASLIPNLLSYPLTWTGTWSRYHADMLFFESLGTSLARLGPLDSIYTPDALIRYHWLVYAWSGQVAEATVAEPFVVLTRVLPLVAVLASCLIGVAWASRLSGAIWAPALAVVLLVAGGYVGATYGAIFNFDSPSQSLTTAWLLGLSFVVVVLMAEGGDRPDARGAWWLLAGVGVLAFAIAGGKISAGAVGVGAVVWVGLIGVLRGASWRRRGAAAAVVALGALILGYLLIVAGSADPGGLKLVDLIDRASSIQGLNPVPGSLGIILGTLILAVAIAVRWSGLAWLLSDSRRRWEPDTVLGVGLILGAVSTVLLVSGGMNDTWFALAASAPLAVLSAAGAGEAWLSLSDRRWRALVWGAGAAVVIYAAVTLLWTTGASGGNVFATTGRWSGPLVGVVAAAAAGAAIGRRYGVSSRRSVLAGVVIVLVLLSAPGRALGVGTGQVGVQPGLGSDAFSPIESFTTRIDPDAVTEWSGEHLAAARWLRERAPGDDLVVTNVTFSPFVPALTGLRTYVSGILYQAPYGRPSGVSVLRDREAQAWAFIDRPSAVTAAPLCESGVRWAWIDPSRTEARDWAPIGEVVFENDAAIILRLSGARCA